MKIREKHYMRLSEIIAQSLPSERMEKVVSMYKNGEFRNAEKCKDLKLRFCFDIFYHVMREKSDFVSDLYEYLNDDHIYTALKKTLSYELKKLGV